GGVFGEWGVGRIWVGIGRGWARREQFVVCLFRGEKGTGARICREFFYEYPPSPLTRPPMDHPGSPADHGDALDLDQHAGPREVRHRDERAGRVVAVGEELPAQFDEAVAVARIVDEH